MAKCVVKSQGLPTSALLFQNVGMAETKSQPIWIAIATGQKSGNTTHQIKMTVSCLFFPLYFKY